MNAVRWMRGSFDLALVVVVLIAVWTRTPLGGLGQGLEAWATDTESELALLDFFTTGQVSPEVVAILPTQVVQGSPADLPEGALPEPYRSAVQATLAADADADTAELSVEEHLARLDALHRGNPEATLEVYAVGEELRERAIARARSAGEKDPESFAAHRRYLPRREAARADKLVGETLGAAAMLTLGWPVPADWKVGSRWGPRVSPITGKPGFHNGVDIGMPIGTEVLSAQSGTVAVVGADRVSGNYVIVDHGHGVRTSYCHLSEQLVERGDRVERGDLIALSGNTGNSTGPHLHFVLRVGKSSVDPMPFKPEAPDRS